MKYLTLESFSAALALIVEDTDFEAIGQVKEHDNSKPNEPKAYLSATVSLPGAQGITIGGEKFFPSRIQVGVNAMRLKAEPRVVDETREPKAATANSSALKALLPAKPVAIPASKV